MKLGVHVSIAGSIDMSIERAKKLNCNTFQIFTRNPRGWIAKELIDNKIQSFQEKVKLSNINPIFAHMPYLANLSSSKDLVLKKSINMYVEELHRCNQLKIPYLITHPGSNRKESREVNIKKIISSINSIFENYSGKTKLLIENIAGKSGVFGAKIEDLIEIINLVKNRSFLGICFDTCHAFASGYDIRDKRVIVNISNLLEDTIGFDFLNCIHCNDSLFDLGEGKDRHEHIGLGKIGDLGFLQLLRNKRFREIPFILETPIDERRDDKGNLSYIRNLYNKIN